MLTKDQLLLLQNKFQTTRENVMREYAQHLFLSSLYRIKNSENILFKGGTAYRLAYKSPRFSEDLDFSASQINLQAIEKIIMNVLEDLTNNGLACDIEESKETTGGYLSMLSVSFLKEKTPISIQISFREQAKKNPDIFDIVNEYVPTYTVLLLSSRIMFGEKIQAALTRSKPRDFYDIYFLLRQGLLNPSEKEKIMKIKDVLKTKKIKFKDELSHFLPRSMKSVADSFPKPLLLEIEKFG